MSFQVFTDSSANLPEADLRAAGIGVVPLYLSVNGAEMSCDTSGASFDGDAFYERLRKEKNLVLKTSMANTAAFTEAFAPCLAAGEDVLYVAMSSGISGTCNAGHAAAEALNRAYPGRSALVVDTLGASLGEGLLVLEAAALRERGVSLMETVNHLIRRRMEMRQYFMVDDLQFLKRGGRIGEVTARVGTVLNIKPILMGDDCGRITADRKVPGRRRALATLFELFERYWIDAPENRRVGIAHSGCEKDALKLRDALLAAHPALTFTVVCYEPGTGAHVGPDTVALFFFGMERGAERTAVLPAIKKKLAKEAEELRASIGQKRGKSGE